MIGPLIAFCLIVALVVVYGNGPYDDDDENGAA